MTAAELRRIKLMGMLRFGKRLSIGSVAELKEIDTVFTDSGLFDEELRMYRSRGACVEVVS